MPTYNQPDNSSDYWKPRDFVGQLCLFEVVRYDPNYSTPLTRPGDEGAVIAHVTILSGPKGGSVFLDTACNWAAIRSALRASIGGYVLGRIAVGAAQPGKNPAFLIADYTPEDAKIADSYFASGGHVPDEEPPAPPVQAYQPPLPGAQPSMEELEAQLARAKAALAAQGRPDANDPAPY